MCYGGGGCSCGCQHKPPEKKEEKKEEKKDEGPPWLAIILLGLLLSALLLHGGGEKDKKHHAGVKTYSAKPLPRAGAPYRDGDGVWHVEPVPGSPLGATSRGAEAAPLGRGPGASKLRRNGGSGPARIKRHDDDDDDHDAALGGVDMAAWSDAASEGGGALYVRVGAFRDRERALQTAAQLTAVGRPIVQTVSMDGEDVRRVYVGPPWAGPGGAEAARDSLSDMGYEDARVVSLAEQ
jgi:hypothetical protein